MNFTLPVSIAAAVVLAITGWFATTQTSLATKVDTLSNQQATTAQKVADVDDRLVRIENKLDQILRK